MFGTLQWFVLVAISYTAFIGGVWAIYDITRRSAGSFVSAGKQSKPLWLMLMIVATALLFVVLPFPLGNGGGALGFIGLIGATIVIIYHVGVKPALGSYPKGPRNGGHSTKGGW